MSTDMVYARIRVLTTDKTGAFTEVELHAAAPESDNLTTDVKTLLENAAEKLGTAGETMLRKL